MSWEHDRTAGSGPGNNGDWTSPPTPRTTTAVYNESKADVRVNLDAIADDVDFDGEKKQPPNGEKSPPPPKYAYGWCTHRIHVLQVLVHGALQGNLWLIKRVFLGLTLVCFSVYFTFALMYNPYDCLLLSILSAFAVAGAIFSLVKHQFGGQINDAVCAPLDKCLDKPWWKYVRW